MLSQAFFQSRGNSREICHAETSPVNSRGSVNSREAVDVARGRPFHRIKTNRQRLVSFLFPTPAYCFSFPLPPVLSLSLLSLVLNLQEWDMCSVKDARDFQESCRSLEGFSLLASLRCVYMGGGEGSETKVLSAQFTSWSALTLTWLMCQCLPLQGLRGQLSPGYTEIKPVFVFSSSTEHCLSL